MYIGDGIWSDDEVPVVENVSVAVAVEGAAVEVRRCVAVHLLEVPQTRTAHPRRVKHRPTVISSKRRQMIINSILLLRTILSLFVVCRLLLSNSVTCCGISVRTQN